MAIVIISSELIIRDLISLKINMLGSMDGAFGRCLMFLVSKAIDKPTTSQPTPHQNINQVHTSDGQNWMQMMTLSVGFPISSVRCQIFYAP